MTERRSGERPRRLPASATLVVWGARRLFLTEKVVWYHDWLMDYLEGPDGSYMSAKSMSERLGQDVSPRTVEQARWFLGKHGLYFAFKREGSHQMGRVCTLPEECTARSNKAAPAMALILDRRLPERSSMGNVPDILPPQSNGTAGNEPRSGSSVRVEGGRGEGSTPSSGSLPERQLFSAVVVENREVAHAPERGKRLPGETAAAWMERLAAHG